MMELLVAVIFSTLVPIYLCGPGGSHKREGSLLTREPWRSERMASTSPACLSLSEPFLPSNVGNGLAGEFGLTPLFLGWLTLPAIARDHPKVPILNTCSVKVSMDATMMFSCPSTASSQPLLCSPALLQPCLACWGESQAN